MRSCFIVIMGIFILASLAVSATIHIPGDYPTIQAGIDAAVNGDTVLVANGTYTGTGNKNLDFLGKAIVVKSENGPENCIIDCENDGRGFYFHLNETNASVLDGFTITNGHVSERGGAIFLENSSPLIYNCAINSNTAQISGGGISCMSYSNPLIYSCEITENIAEYNGGGIQCAINSNPSINDCLIANNTAYNHGGGIDSWDSSPIISDCIISENLTVGDVSNGGGIHCDGNSEVNVSYSLIINNEAYEGGGLDSWLSNTQITNCTISGNTARLNAGGIRFAFNSSSDVLNTLIEGNENGGIIISDSPDMSITYCDFYNNEQFSFGGNTVPAGLGELVSININGDSCDVFNNIFENPEFYSLSGDSAFYLTFNSSCIDAGNPDSIYFDPDGTIADIGAYYFDQTGLNGALSGFISAGTYHIIGDISVNEGYSLEIDAGTQFLFDGDYSFNINGCLLAIGNEIDSIIFKANEGIPQWEGIDFNDSADDSCRMEYCKITGSNSSGIEIISANISLKNCSVDGNWGLNGGGIKCQNANPTIENCLISNNESGSDGGGLYCDNSNPYIIGSTINSNSANNWAGGILLDESSPAISSTTVSDNSAGVNGGGVVMDNYSNPIIQNCNIINNNGNWGGGIFCRDNSSPTITNTNISENTSGSNGGGIHAYYANPVFDSCTIMDNYAASAGGGISIGTSDFQISNSIIKNNTSISASGGGIYCTDSDPVIISCEIIENSSPDNYGGGIHCVFFSSPSISYCIFSGNSSYRGGGVSSSGSSPYLNRCTIVQNSVTNNGGGCYMSNSQATLLNCIVTQNFGYGGAHITGINPVNITYCDFYNNEGGNFTGSPPAGLGAITSVNINGDSCDVYYNILEDPNFYSTLGDSAYYLWDFSPCVNAGDPNSPLDPDSTIADMGAMWPPVEPLYITIHIPGDYPTIQAGIDAAVDGDTVLVADSTWTGAGNKNLDFGGKAITVKSENGPDNCIIDCEGDGRGFYFHSGEDTTSVVDGFTIMNGYVAHPDYG